MVETFCTLCFKGCSGGVCHSLRSTKVHCSKCGKKIYLNHPHKITTKKGDFAVEGVCPKCGATVIK